ncbi:hypothetical protein M404DRAFT_141396, partial [Pisolithus tinctorius Marx 270]
MHPRFEQKECVVRPEGHHTLPNFIGCYFPTQDDPDCHAFYCASMLMLLKPWWDLGTDLKESHETWEHALSTFLASAPTRIHHIISGVQYFHRCEKSAQ